MIYFVRNCLFMNSVNSQCSFEIVICIIECDICNNIV